MVEEAKPLMVIGSKLTWIYTPRGGCGYTMRIPCRVLARGKRVKVEVRTVKGETVERFVKPESLTFRSQNEMLMLP